MLERLRVYEQKTKPLVDHYRGRPTFCRIDGAKSLELVAASIADEESNIQNVTVDPQDGGRYATMNFTLQVADRNHLARIMIELRRIPEVARITRLRA